MHSTVVENTETIDTAKVASGVTASDRTDLGFTIRLLVTESRRMSAARHLLESDLGLLDRACSRFRIAHSLAELARPIPDPGLRETVERRAGLAAGRGACHHPDGSVRLVRSALTVFDDELRLHAAGVCSAPSRTPFLPLPAGAPRTDEDWSWSPCQND